ncbi:MAG: 30S ribosomal protein S12 methylthiotransferase RimO, partial [Oscillospiraceae bacterium]|nr:30S ribosomal protein S12 methylthiotransferase RimO [Oscillospiraceae bacterium]
MKKRIGLVSLGCAKNLVNSEQMLHLLDEAGYEITGDTENIDAVVVNTCGFIDSAKMEAIDTILELGQAKAQGKIGKIIVAGCLAQRYKDELLEEMPEIDSIVGVGSFDKIVSVVKKTLEYESVSEFSDIDHTNEEIDRVNTTSPAWAYIKIAEGCDNCCAYCIIPKIRGRYRSRELESVVAEAQRMAQNGIKELIVVAQDITRFGKDRCGHSQLPELLRRLCGIEGFEWIRLHYLYPDEITDELIDVIAQNDKIIKYLDIPLQHIDDRILKTMCRRGSSQEIYALLHKLRERIPGLVLRTSLITGLPGEGEAEFEELLDWLKEVRIERVGVFPFSPEEGT